MCCQNQRPDVSHNLQMGNCLDEVSIHGHVDVADVFEVGVEANERTLVGFLHHRRVAQVPEGGDEILFLPTANHGSLTRQRKELEFAK